MLRRPGLSLGSFLHGTPRRLNTVTSPTERILYRQPFSWCCSKRLFPPTPTLSPPLQSSRLYSTSHGQTHIPPHPQKHYRDLYSVMEVSPKATQQQIKDKFYQLSMLYHPDRNKGSQIAHQRFSEITEAYSILGQHDLRRRYDKGLLQEYPRKPHADTHPHRYRHPETTMSTSPKKIYDFDEFYRAHYGEALKWQRQQTASRKAAAAQAERLQTLSEPMHRVLVACAVLSVFIVGWVGVKYREQQEREGKWV